MKPPKYSNLPKRFWDKVTPIESGCWEWTGSRKPTGYGLFRMDGATKRVHRLSAQDSKGNVPDALHVLHTCDNPSCVYPNHLYFGTHQENMKDMVQRGRGAKGERNGLSKLTKHDVLEIRRLYPAVSAPVLAKRFGVHHSTIYSVSKRKWWNHV